MEIDKTIAERNGQIHKIYVRQILINLCLQHNVSNMYNKNMKAKAILIAKDNNSVTTNSASNIIHGILTRF